MSIRPLEGIRVVEIGQNLAGPICSEILAALGADVVKVERPEGGDDCRGWGPPFPSGMGTAFQVLNLNKRSITLDMKDPAKLAWLKGFIGEADVLVHNMRPGVMVELGLGGPELTRQFPRLVYAEITGFGAVGPMKSHPGYDAIVQALSGLFHLNGDPDSRPSRVGPSVLDYGSGMWAAIGCLAALRERDRTGKGSIVDTSLLETSLFYTGPAAATLSMTGKAPARLRAGVTKVVPFEAFPTSDGEVIVAAANDRLFQKLAVATGMPELARDERFLKNANRAVNKDLLVGMLDEVFRRRSTEEWVVILEKAGIPCSPVNTLEQAVVHPQVAALEMAQIEAGTGLRLPKLPLRFNGERPAIRRTSPSLGQHNDEILKASANSA